MQKFLIKFGLVGSILFLGFFCYYYRKTKKFRKSFITAFAVVSFYLSALQPTFARPIEGTDAWLSGSSQVHQNANQKGKGVFGPGGAHSGAHKGGSGPDKPDPNNSGSGEDDGFSMPSFRKPKSVSETAELAQHIDSQIIKLDELEEETNSDLENQYELEEETDSESESQCELEEENSDDELSFLEEKQEIRNLINQDPGLVRAAKKALKDQSIQRGVKKIEKELRKGNKNPGSGWKSVARGVIEHRTKNGARVYTRTKDGVVEVLGYSNKQTKNQNFVIKRIKELYN